MVTTVETEAGLEYTWNSKNTSCGTRREGNPSPFPTYLFIDSFTEDSEHEDSCDWRPQVARDGLCIVDQLSTLRYFHYGDPQDAGDN